MSLEDLDDLLNQCTPGSDDAEEADKPLVLVVDDDMGVLSGLEAILSDGYRVLPARSAAEAVAAINDDVWAVVLDIKMEDHDGFWVCDQIRKLYVHLPVIFHSAYQEAKAPFDIINDHQPFGYVTKGTSPDILLTLLERAVRNFKIIVEGRAAVALRASLAPGPLR